MAADLVFLLPTNNDFGITLGLPICFKGVQNMAIDFAPEFSIHTTDPKASINLLVPVKFTFSLTGSDLIEGGTGMAVEVWRLRRRSGHAAPNRRVGHTLKIKDKVMMDLIADFGFSPLVLFTAGNGQDIDRSRQRLAFFNRRERLHPAARKEKPLNRT
ncbi:MAG: hypothetical protein R3A47_01750 [Polyangiales bacterium]